MIVSIFVFVVIAVLALPAALVLLPFTLLSGRIGPLYATGKWIARIGLCAGGIRIQVEGQEKIPAGRACIFMANHVSNLDPPVLLMHLPGRCSFFVKRGLMNLPILGYAFHLGQFIPVDRGGDVKNARLAVATAQRILSGGLHIATFIEGRRSPDARLLPFKKGPFYLAKDSSALCVPVSIHGTEQMLPWGSARMRSGVAHIVFHEPIDPAQYATREELSAAVRAAIAAGLPEWMRG